MSLIKKITPVNLLEEKKKFFTDETYNPQFKYATEFDDDILYKHGYPQSKYLDLSQTILDKVHFKYAESDLDKLRGASVNQSQVTKKTVDFLKIHQLEERFKIVWSNSFVSRATITTDTIKLKLPTAFREQDLLSMLYHEIGTHALRRINYEQQPWHKKKKKYKFKNYLKTEEGLAGLHSLLPLDFQYAFYPALNYVSVAYAQQHSFSETWHFLKKYIDNPERCWERTLRRKRGLKDTSQPGGFTKDMVYLEGMIEVWNYLNKNNFDLTKLYFGKMSWEDVDTAVKMNPDFKPLLPSFYEVDKEKYSEKLKEIGKLNMFI